MENSDLYNKSHWTRHLNDGLAFCANDRCFKWQNQLPSQDLPSDSDDKGKFGLGWHIEVSNFASHATEADFTPVHLPVLLVILLSPFVDQLPGHLSCLWQAKVKTHVRKWAKINQIPHNLVSVNSVKHYLFRSHDLLDSNGLHGGEGLSPFQKALRDRRNFFSVANIITIQDQARMKGTVAYACDSTLQDRHLVASASLLLNYIATPGPASTET